MTVFYVYDRVCTGISIFTDSIETTVRKKENIRKGRHSGLEMLFPEWEVYSI
jgi:hypothetical protein